jgi:hypothetical protein
MTMVYVSIFPSPCHPDVENIRGVDEVYTTVPTQRYERNDDKCGTVYCRYGNFTNSPGKS